MSPRQSLLNVHRANQVFIQLQRLTCYDDNDSSHDVLDQQLLVALLQPGLEVCVPDDLYRHVRLQCVRDEDGDGERYLHTLRQTETNVNIIHQTGTFGVVL